MSVILSLSSVDPDIIDDIIDDKNIIVDSY
jgi:hypothetical protein